MEYDVEREQGQWHIRERGQVSRGTTVTDAWLASMGFGTLTRSNVDAVVKATMASVSGVVLDGYAARRMPRDIDFTPGFQSFPSTPDRGRLPRNPGKDDGVRRRLRPRIPERMLFRG